MRFDNLTDSFRVANKMIVSFSGTDYVFEKGNDKFEKVILALEKIVVDNGIDKNSEVSINIKDCSFSGDSKVLNNLGIGQ